MYIRRLDPLVKFFYINVLNWFMFYWRTGHSTHREMEVKLMNPPSFCVDFLTVTHDIDTPSDMSSVKLICYLLCECSLSFNGKVNVLLYI